MTTRHTTGRCTLAAGLALLACAVAHSQQPATFTPEQLRQDVTAIEAAIERTHPDIAHSVDPAVLGRAIEDVRAKLDHPMSAGEAWTVLSRLNSVMADGHAGGKRRRCAQHAERWHPEHQAAEHSDDDGRAALCPGPQLREQGPAAARRAGRGRSVPADGGGGNSHAPRTRTVRCGQPIVHSQQPERRRIAALQSRAGSRVTHENGRIVWGLVPRCGNFRDPDRRQYCRIRQAHQLASAACFRMACRAEAHASAVARVSEGC